jgi:hypothetical protein
MFEPRMLSRHEGLLRDPASGGVNLAAAPGVWHDFAPVFDDEVIDIGSIGMRGFGPDLLANLDSFGGQPARLEISVEVEDGYGRPRDLAGLTPCRIENGVSWRQGTFANTVLDPKAGRLADSSERLALRGTDLYLPGNPPQVGLWESAPIDLRYGRDVMALSWEVWPAADASGNVAAPPTIAVRVGDKVSGSIVWQPQQIVAQSAAEVALGHVDLSTPLTGDVVEWSITLPYLDTGSAGRGDNPVLRTASVFSLCAWIAMSSHRFRFDSLAEILDRAELSRHVAPSAFGGADDGFVLRVPLAVLLRGRLRERIRARLVSPGATAIRGLELHVVGDLAFDRPGS